MWCEGAEAPKLLGPEPGTAPTDIKVLSYNLFWWHLFQVQGGNNHSAGKLILANMDQPFDAMGFQECEDPKQVLEPVGLLGRYEVIWGPHATCMAYDTKAWKMLANGRGEVGEDIPMRYYGKRGTQWMRLANLETGAKLFFINHHGPLSINSGGICGGKATAYNLLQMVARHSVPGDAVVLVGDFNSNAGSLTIQHLWRHLVHVFVGPSFGGVDNIFSNLGMEAVTETKVLGSGGSDHSAISATLRLGQQEQTMTNTINAPTVAVNELTGKAKPGHDWQWFWCGLMEMHTDYVMDVKAWTNSSSAKDPDRCCRACQDDTHCAAWTWKGGSCLLSGAAPSLKKPANGVVSGLSYAAAATEAKKAAAEAIQQM